MAQDEFFQTLFGNGQPRLFLGTSFPTTGTYYTGDIVQNSAPGPVAFWVCTAGSTSGGTWLAVNIAQNSAAVTPASGTFAVGDIVYNSAPAANAPFGWINTVAGSPGTFVPLGFAVNAALTTTATSGTLSSAYSMILLNPASTGTYSLPNVTAYASGAELYIKNIASGSTTLTPLGANSYDVAAITLAQFASVTLRSAGGTVWYRQQ